MSYNKGYIPRTYSRSVGLLDEKSCGDKFCFKLFITNIIFNSLYAKCDQDNKWHAPIFFDCSIIRLRTTYN